MNGKPSEILRANHAFMAVPIPAGVSHVTIQMDRTYANLAQGLSVLVFFLLIFYLTVRVLAQTNQNV